MKGSQRLYIIYAARASTSILTTRKDRTSNFHLLSFSSHQYYLCFALFLFSDMSVLIASWLTPTSLFLLLNVMIVTIFLISRFSPPKTTHQQHFAYDGYNSAPPLQRTPSLLDRVKSINFSTYKFPLPTQDIDHHLQPDNLAAHPLERAPSILEKVKSINFSLYKFSPQNPNTDYVQPTEHDYTVDPQPLSRAPSLLERVKSIDFTSFYRSDSFKSNQQTEPAAAEEIDSDTDTTPVHVQVKRSKSEHSTVKQRKLSEKMKKSASENLRRKAEEKEEEEEDDEEVERRRPATTRVERTVSIGDDVDAKADNFINSFKQQLRLQRLDSLLRYRDMLKGK
ncbi:hypothetical protein DITRI_Ditri03aG0053200 [Diplodiscus trichospermus]